jgi:hypothetical protein
MLGEELTRAGATRVDKIEQHRFTLERRERHMLAVLVRQGHIRQTARVIGNRVCVGFFTGPIAAR